MHLPNLDQFADVLQLLAGVSAVTFGVSLVCIPLLVARLPRNFFQLPAAGRTIQRHQLTVGSIFLLCLRNMIGLALLLAGIAMLFLPGQGLVTIIIGLTIMSFPYKQQLVYSLTRPQSVQRSLDWIRKKSRKESFYW